MAYLTSTLIDRTKLFKEKLKKSEVKREDKITVLVRKGTYNVS